MNVKIFPPSRVLVCLHDCDSPIVRETESLVAHRSSGVKAPVETGKDQGIVDIENRLQQLLGTRVRIKHGKKRGVIQIEYYSTDDMNRILDMLQAKKP